MYMLLSKHEHEDPFTHIYLLLDEYGVATHRP